MNTTQIFCPRCGAQNSRTEIACGNCGKPFPQSAAASAALPHASPLEAQAWSNPPAPRSIGRENTLKPSTVVCLVLGLVVPFWIVTLPLFWILAYFSYKKDWSI